MFVLLLEIEPLKIAEVATLPVTVRMPRVFAALVFVASVHFAFQMVSLNHSWELIGANGQESNLPTTPLQVDNHLRAVVQVQQRVWTMFRCSTTELHRR